MVGWANHKAETNRRIRAYLKAGYRRLSEPVQPDYDAPPGELPHHRLPHRVRQAWPAWLRNLPTLVAVYARRWRLTLGAPYEDLSCNYLIRATRAGDTLAVLKLGMPRDEFLTEAAALEAYAGDAAVRLLEADAPGGALLLERIDPGAPLASLGEAGDEAATEIAATVMARLWRPVDPGHLFPTIQHWTTGFLNGMALLRTQHDGAPGPLPPALVARAEAILPDLHASSAGPVLLHGDLHHFNILAATREPWLVIDPKGVIGEPAHEAGALLRNPVPALLTWTSPEKVLARRLDQLSDLLSLDRTRLKDWAFVQALISAWWVLEKTDHGWEYWVQCAGLLDGLT